MKILESRLKAETEKDKIIETKIWLCYCKFKTNESDGSKEMDLLVSEHEESIVAHRAVWTSQHSAITQ